MPPSAASVTTSGTASSGVSSSVADKLKSLKHFEVDNEHSDALRYALKDVKSKNCDICLVSVPIGFPIERLLQFPLDGNENCIKNGADSYTVTKTDRSNKFLPFPKSDSQYASKTILASYSVTKSIKTVACDKRKFIPRPEFPKISENLIERFRPFGCQISEKKTDDTRLSFSPRKRKHKKKQKRKLQNDDEILDAEADESMSAKQKKRKRAELPLFDEIAEPEHSFDPQQTCVVAEFDVQESEEISARKKAKKEAKKARKEAKKAKKKKREKNM